MRVLITGATGYIGKNLCGFLQNRQVEVLAVVRKESNLSGIQGIPYFVYDNTTESLINAIAEFQPDVVVHLATCFIGRHMADQIEDLVDSNILFGVRLLEAMSSCGVNRFINTATAWQYVGNSPYRPVSLYAATKQALEDILVYYTEDRGIKVITLILNDTYGPVDSRPKVLNLLKNVVKTGQVLEMSPGEQEMNFLYIDDVVSAYWIAIQRCMSSETPAEVFDVMSSKAIPLRQVAELFEKVNGITLPVKWGAKPYREKEIMKAYQPKKPLPGWKPLISMEEGLQLFFAD